MFSEQYLSGGEQPGVGIKNSNGQLLPAARIKKAQFWPAKSPGLSCGESRTDFGICQASSLQFVSELALYKINLF